jgi:uncharacterized protein YqeY
MENLHKQVVEDWKLALKNKDLAKNTLTLIITEFKNRAIKDNLGGDEGRVIDDKAAIEVLMKMAKQRRESIDSYKAAKREDLVAKEEAEVVVIDRYLPKPLSDEELSKLVSEAIAATGASSMADIGKVMGHAIKASGGRADGKRIQTAASAQLSGK